jgi:excisionase family DNA binding protein
MDELTYTVKGACKLTNVGPTTIYQALNEGTLVGKKVGRRTLITRQSLQQWIDGLPSYATKCIEQQTLNH